MIVVVVFKILMRAFHLFRMLLDSLGIGALALKGRHSQRYQVGQRAFVPERRHQAEYVYCFFMPYAFAVALNVLLLVINRLSSLL